MIMAAPLKNTNAEKWTLTESQKFIDSVYTYVSEHKDCCSLTEALTELGQYEDLLNYLNKKFDKIVFRSIKKGKDIIKQRILKKGLNNEYNPTMSIFILKNNHDMKDKQEIDQNIKAIVWNEEKTYINETDSKADKSP